MTGCEITPDRWVPAVEYQISENPLVFKLHRHPESPIILPDLNSELECYNIFNPSVIYYNDLVYMHYCVQALDWISRIGYAVSQDGVHWNRLRHLVMEPIDSTDSRGVEDPRVTEIEGVFYMTYTAYGRDYLVKASRNIEMVAFYP